MKIYDALTKQQKGSFIRAFVGALVNKSITDCSYALAIKHIPSLPRGNYKFGLIGMLTHDGGSLDFEAYVNHIHSELKAIRNSARFLELESIVLDSNSKLQYLSTKSDYDVNVAIAYFNCTLVNAYKEMACLCLPVSFLSVIKNPLLFLQCVALPLGKYIFEIREDIFFFNGTFEEKQYHMQDMHPISTISFANTFVASDQLTVATRDQQQMQLVKYIQNRIDAAHTPTTLMDLKAIVLSTRPSAKDLKSFYVAQGQDLALIALLVSPECYEDNPLVLLTDEQQRYLIDCISQKIT
jgi:hypothetical protein